LTSVCCVLYEQAAPDDMEIGAFDYNETGGYEELE